MKIILLNGAPGSGKDTAAKVLIDYVNKNSRMRGNLVKFASPLKKAVHALFALDVPEDYFEGIKDEPHPLLHGRKPRDVYIDISEQFVKPILSQDHFTKTFITACDDILDRHHEKYQKDTIIVCSDLGFQMEIDAVIAHFGKENVFLLQIQRPGYTFQNDSRNYVQSGCGFEVIENDSSPMNFIETLVIWIHLYLGEQYGSKY